jgi:hypothetical protein
MHGSYGSALSNQKSKNLRYKKESSYNNLSDINHATYSNVDKMNMFNQNTKQWISNLRKMEK